MRITRFETRNHPILGDCSVDFKVAGESSSVILMGGTNGSGKTTILNEIFSLFTELSPRQKDFDLRAVFELNDAEIDILRGINADIDQELTIEVSRAIGGQVSWNQVKGRTSAGREIRNDFFRKEEFKELLKVVYSTVEINFAGGEVRSTTAQDVDAVKSPKDRSGGNVSQEIAQLLVDIKALDNQDAGDWMDANRGRHVEVVPQERRISRFKRAFDYMIEGKTFTGVKNEGGRKKVYFTDDDGVEIDISQLSSGEKQIVFRAGYLLKNIGSLSGGIALVDEPELSLHPKWQEKYVGFVREMFSSAEGEMLTQVLVATHSPFILQNENITNEKVLVLEKDGRNTIESAWPKFYGYTQPEPVFTAMQAPSAPLLLVEGEGDKKLLLRAWELLHPDAQMPFDIKWAGEPNSGGAGMLQRQLLVLQQHSTIKVLGMFDADERGLNDFKGTKTKQAVDFLADATISSLKVLNKVGATYLPVPPGREKYLNITTPRFSLLAIEHFLPDTTLASLGLVKAAPIQVGVEQLIELKDNHSLDDLGLASLAVADVAAFQLLFDHAVLCLATIP